MKKIVGLFGGVAILISFGILGAFALPYAANYRTPFLGHGAGVYLERPQDLFSHATYALDSESGNEEVGVYDFSRKWPFFHFVLVEYAGECQCVTSIKRWNEFVYWYPPYTKNSGVYYVLKGAPKAATYEDVKGKLEEGEVTLQEVREKYADTIRKIKNNTFFQ